MNGFTISPTPNKNKVFLLQKSEVEKRLDPFYYIPELVELERKILAKHPKKLRDYVLSVASGATPKRDEEEKYYSDAQNGIPFLRVQNVTEFGLDLSDVKYINKETHEGYLKRSQVSENDLLVTITGRIASAAVAPKGFIGNINQHSVVIKTESREVSEMLASFLNCSIGQKLALRETTGGTRPALDYPALLSIPILNDKRVVEIIKKVVEQKKHNETEAEKLLASIDDYLLKELGITYIEQDNSLQGRIFTTQFSEVTGNRLDSYFYKNQFIAGQINNGLFKSVSFSSIINSLINGFDFRDYKDSGTPYIKVANVKKGEFDFAKIQYINTETMEISKAIQLKKDNILLTRKGTFGNALCLENDFDYIISSEVFYIEIKHELVDSKFLEIFFNSAIGQKQFDRVKIGAIMGSLSQEAVKALKIPLPPLTKQKEIAEHISAIRKEAQQLKDKTKEELKKASNEIEKILLT